MIIGLTGLAFKPGSSFPPYGTFLSAGCTAADGYDYFNNYWSGEWNYSVTRADGAGGSYTNVEGSNTEGCWIPYGYMYSSSNSDLQINWSHGPDSGTFTYGTYSESTYSNGSGGSAGGSGNNITAYNGQVAHSYGYYDYASNYPMTSYLKFETATNTLVEYNFIDAGTNVGESCGYGDLLDQSGTTWNFVYFKLTTYADGNGGSYYGANQYNDPTCGYLPYGFWDTYSQYNLDLYYYDEYGTYISFQYGKGWNGYMEDSFGGNFYSDGSELWYSYGHVFYSYYDSAGMQTVYYAFDGSSGYYTYTT
jgi:hypothetical protein